MPILQSREDTVSGPNTFAEHWRSFQASKPYDLLAALPMFGFYSLTAGSMIRALVGKFANLGPENIGVHFIVDVLAQGASVIFVLMVLAFVLLRRPAEAKAKGLMPRFAAMAGTYLGISVVWLAPAQSLGLGLSLLSLTLVLGGVAFSIYSLHHLGRSFSLNAEARRLVTDGPYAYVRHPLYLGEAVSMLGLTLQYVSVAALAIFLLQLAFQLQRMTNEERVLSGRFLEYESYRRGTARLVPGLY